MSITPNGIAQGLVTDMITDYLKSEGVQHTLINLGEYRAIGEHPEGRPWELGIRAPGSLNGNIIDSLALEDDQSLAVSGGYGATFDADDRCHHLIHPTLPLQQPADRTVAVRADRAMVADALSTACAVVDDPSARAMALRLGAHLRIYQS